jgi:hypothetical protein
VVVSVGASRRRDEGFSDDGDYADYADYGNQRDPPARPFSARGAAFDHADHDDYRDHGDDANVWRLADSGDIQAQLLRLWFEI